MVAVIETTGLRKSFASRERRARGKRVEAVSGVDLRVEQGEIFGFLGPNGAGKTTTLRMLATLMEPDGGAATIAGADLRRHPEQVRRAIGYVAQGGATWDDSTAREELVLQAQLYGLSRAQAARRAQAALAAFQLTDYADRTCKTYSGGQRRRVDIALGIIHSPTVVFLDEPTSGLDPQSRVHMWDEVRRLRDEGMTVFLTTHYLDEADALCDRVAIIDSGRIVAEGTVPELKREISTETVLIGLPATAVAAATAALTGPAASAGPAALTGPAALAGPAASVGPGFLAGVVDRVESVETGLRLAVADGATAIPVILRALDAAGVPIASVELRRPSLDDVFLIKTGRSLRES